jgi:hypothetical protein
MIGMLEAKDAGEVLRGDEFVDTIYSAGFHH